MTMNYILLALLLPLVSANVHHTNATVRDPVSVLVGWRIEEYGQHILILSFMLFVVLLKMAYRIIHGLTDWVPESLIQILAGTLFGGLTLFIPKQYASIFKLHPDLFFHYLLPPIVFEAALAMYTRNILDYVSAITMLAVIGSILNFVLMALLMWGLYSAGAFGLPHLGLDIKGFMLFSSFIIAVDPVAVLAIFQDVGVEDGLYYTIFGESLFNDAVTVVLYQVMTSFSGLPAVTFTHICIALLSFFTISVGGSLIGVIGGVITCFLTRFPIHLSPATVILMAYLSYIMSDCLGWSGIMALICCGLIQVGYAFHNMSRNAIAMVRKLAKITSEITESIIFLFMGLEVIQLNLQWHTGFCLWALFLCLFVRGIVTLSLVFIYNYLQLGSEKITKKQEFIIMYGGLRGAVCFCLAVLVQPYYFVDNGQYKKTMFMTTTVIIILFTNFVMGLTIKPLVMWLRPPQQQQEILSYFMELIDYITFKLCFGIEIIADEKGRNRLLTFLSRIDGKYIRPLLQRTPETHDEKLLQLHEKITMKLHYATMQPAKSEMHLNRLAPNIQRQFEMERRASASTPPLPGAIVSEEHTQAEDAANISPASSVSMVLDSQSSETEECTKICRWPCCQKRRLTQTVPQLPTDPSVSQEAGTRQSTSITDDQLLMSRLLRSNRQISVIGRPEESDFADNLRQVLRSKSILLSQMQKKHPGIELTDLQRARTSRNRRQNVEISDEVSRVMDVHRVNITPRRPRM